ncbi:hypothetical protein ACTFIZ_009393 [Dictyostelium cf. discoideum]
MGNIIYPNNRNEEIIYSHSITIILIITQLIFKMFQFKKNCNAFIKLPSYNQLIQKDVLPSSLTLLSISNSFNSTIDRDALPQNLKSFYFTGYYFKELPDLIWRPPSFKFIYIHGDSLDFINSIPTHFFIKHVKLLKNKK